MSNYQIIAFFYALSLDDLNRKLADVNSDVNTLLEAIPCVYDKIRDKKLSYLFRISSLSLFKTFDVNVLL